MFYHFYTQQSPIHGVGLFTRDTIPKDTCILLAFVKGRDGRCAVSRRGQLINHSSRSYNTTLVEKEYGYYLFANQTIHPYQEILANYWDTPACISKPKPDWNDH